MYNQVTIKYRNKSTFCHTAVATVAITHAFTVFIAISSLRIAGFFAVSESFRISSLTNAFGFRSVPTACVLACQGTASLHCKTFGTRVFHLLSTFIIIALFSPVGYVSTVCTPSLWLRESFFQYNYFKTGVRSTWILFIWLQRLRSWDTVLMRHHKCGYGHKILIYVH